MLEKVHAVSTSSFAHSLYIPFKTLSLAFSFSSSIFVFFGLFVLWRTSDRPLTESWRNCMPIRENYVFSNQSINEMDQRGFPTPVAFMQFMQLMLRLSSSRYYHRARSLNKKSTKIHLWYDTINICFNWFTRQLLMVHRFHYFLPKKNHKIPKYIFPLYLYRIPVYRQVKSQLLLPNISYH